MDYKGIKVPYLSREDIKTKANLFRQKFWNDSIPVDIEKIIDVKLKIDIVPALNLYNFCDTDALISSNWKLIWVDKDRFTDERHQNRLRFALAHEMGHFNLHKEIYKSLNIKTILDFYKSIEQISENNYASFEFQANNFASFLLIPRKKLKIEKDKILKKGEIGKSIPLEKVDIKTLNSYLAIPISRFFGVSEEATSYALDDIK